MRNGILVGVVCLAVGAGLAQAQAPALPPAPGPIAPGSPVPPGPPVVLKDGPVLPTYPPPPPSPTDQPAAGGATTNLFFSLTWPEPGNVPRVWVGVEGLAWWVKNQPLSVPVLTTGPAALGSAAGGFGAPGTTAIRSPLDYGLEAGLRLNAGGWFSDAHVFGFDASGFFLQQKSAGFAVGDFTRTGAFVINEPLAGAIFPTQVSAPGFATGAAAVNTSSRFSGFDVNGVYHLYQDDDWGIQLLAGFRYLGLYETLTVGNSSTLLAPLPFNVGAGPGAAPPGSGVVVADYFGTRNQFYGGQLGVRFEGALDNWFVGGVAKVALGTTYETISAWGATVLSPVNAAPVVVHAGNYVLWTNAGRYKTNQFAAIPEVQLTLGYQLGAHVRAVVGYNFLYWSNVARPGNQLDNVYDGLLRPAMPLASSSFWAQGLTFSLLVSY
jgi:hypothetical protein